MKRPRWRCALKRLRHPGECRRPCSTRRLHGKRPGRSVILLCKSEFSHRCFTSLVTIICCINCEPLSATYLQPFPRIRSRPLSEPLCCAHHSWLLIEACLLGKNLASRAPARPRG